MLGYEIDDVNAGFGIVVRGNSTDGGRALKASPWIKRATAFVRRVNTMKWGGAAAVLISDCRSAAARRRVRPQHRQDGFRAW